MGFLDRLMSSMRLTQDNDEDFFDDEEEDYEEDEKPAKRGFFSGAREDDNYEEEEPRPRLFSRSSSKVVPMKRSMEVSLVKPTSMDDGSLIVDYLVAGKAVVLNMEGLYTELAQRIIDFSSGAAYSMNGRLQKISNYIFIVTPESVELTGEFQEALNESKLDNVSGLNIHL